MLTPDQEETARLVMMEMRDQGDRSIIHFNTQLRAVLEIWDKDKLSIGDISRVWQKYMGIDRLVATHDLDTGRLFR